MATLECEIRNLNGGIHTVKVSPAAKVWRLQNEIEAMLGIPDYEQQLVCGSVQLRSEMFLSELMLANDSSRLHITLVRTPTPECLDVSSAKWIWNAFLSFSDDEGGTIPIRHVNALMQYAGMRKSAAQFNECDSERRKLSFPELLSLMAEWKESVEPPPASLKNLERELELLDPDGTGFVTRRDFTRATARIFEDSDDSDNDNEDDSDSDDGDELERHNAVDRVEWRKELQEIFSEAPDDFLW
eukprot:TRINITY_DN4948_c0_g5_i1.p1 TRINITY_DN4948_c0_g5~~TRINITY_DN4948_c0_g5_i1.p1  ORF type:complete len:243 (+),score=69.37 TRINITY_DN4948_c0_g5_i1:91-819(+)